jgi:hypothetical protein
MATDRWSPQRKAVLLLAIDYDLLSIAEASIRFAVSNEELAAWRRQFGRHGVPAMRSTRLQLYPECRSC